MEAGQVKGGGRGGGEGAAVGAGRAGGAGWAVHPAHSVAAGRDTLTPFKVNIYHNMKHNQVVQLASRIDVLAVD